MVRVLQVLSGLRRRGPEHATVAVGRPAPRESMVGAAAPPIAGPSPAGQPVEHRAGDRDGLVVFLTSSCLACRDIWSALSAGAPAGLPRAPAVVVVTPDPTLEDARRVAALAPPGLPVVMSTPAWQAYGAAASPWIVRVVAGTVVAEGPASGWTDVEAIAARGSGEGSPRVR